MSTLRWICGKAAGTALVASTLLASAGWAEAGERRAFGKPLDIDLAAELAQAETEASSEAQDTDPPAFDADVGNFQRPIGASKSASPKKIRSSMATSVRAESEACERRDGAPVSRLRAQRTPPIRLVGAQDPSKAELGTTNLRQFKRMAEIKPFADYEPDAGTLEKDRCKNLCPRPADGTCPPCENGEGENRCPGCPAEIDIKARLEELGMPSTGYHSRAFPLISYCWEPTNLYHTPLYFEDCCLERYGHTRHYMIQPVFSAGLLALQFVGLPYQMSIDPICKKRYTLGWYRAGVCIPPRYYQVPWNTEAAITEAGVLTGAYFLFAPSVSP